MKARSLIPTILVVLSLCGVSVARAEAVTQFGSEGSGAGQFSAPWGVAVDMAAGGNVYVADRNNNRIDVFEPSGGFVMAWGWGVLDGAEELQTCTTSCQIGLGGQGAGQFGAQEVQRIAVDNDPLSTSYGNVYVRGNAPRMEEFSSSGVLLSTFGESQMSGGEGAVAIGPEGRVYVGDRGRVDVFEASGVWRENISLVGMPATESPASLAVDSSGDLFVGYYNYTGIRGVHEFEPDGVEEATFDAGSTIDVAIALDEQGDLFIDQDSAGNTDSSPGELSLLEYSPSGEQLASFAHGAATGYFGGMTLGSVGGVGELYVTNSAGSQGAGAHVTVIPAPVDGPPVIESGSVAGSPEPRGLATVGATIDPEGNATSYKVEYVDEAAYLASGYADASVTAETSVGSGFEEVPVSVQLSGLVPADEYHYRVVATSTQGTASSADGTFTAVPPALIDGSSVTDVTSSSATFSAEIDPLGASTDYRVEYGQTTSYGHSLLGNAGEGDAYVQVSAHQQELLPGTLYHYRVVVHNEVGEYAGPDHTFTTQAAGGQELQLPDGRAWELVSPANKGGALIGPIPFNEDIQAAADGSGITYPASEPIGEDTAGRFVTAQILSLRGQDGWSSRGVAQKSALPPEGVIAKVLGGEKWPIFSSDLSLGLYEPSNGEAEIPQSTEVTERTDSTLYLRDSANATFLPLETAQDVSAGPKFTDETMAFLVGTPDLSHVVFETTAALTPEAVAPPPRASGELFRHNLYEWSTGRLQLVNILPNGTIEPNAFEVGSGNSGVVRSAISADGRWIVWGIPSNAGTPGSLYVRDMVGDRTFQLGGEYAHFEGMSSDGSQVFFIEDAGLGAKRGDLYVFDTATGVTTDLTHDHGAGEADAGVQDAVMGISEDSSYVYFVATGVLAPGGERGADNVYVLHDAGSGWSTSYIATLSDQDSKSWRGVGYFEMPSSESDEDVRLRLVSSSVSPNGRFLTFMSERPLTGYDNLDAVSGQPDEEVYLYDASSGRLVCASCNPTGARPVGVFDDRNGDEAPLAVDLEKAWAAPEGTGNHWLAGSLPGWESDEARATYQPRYLSNSGRLFFESPDALVPQDTNGLEDVYQYEPAGVGSCSGSSSTFSERQNGCVNLISSGQSSNESMFMDASETGNDAFFATNSKLTGEDRDSSYDMYDAHACSEDAPCRSEPVSSPPCTSGDSCKAAPTPQPEIFGPTPSATFSGIGNVIEEVKAKSKPTSKKKTGKKKKTKKKKKKGKKAVRSRARRTSKRGGR